MLRLSEWPGSLEWGIILTQEFGDLPLTLRSTSFRARRGGPYYLELETPHGQLTNSCIAGKGSFMSGLLRNPGQDLYKS